MAEEKPVVGVRFSEIVLKLGLEEAVNRFSNIAPIAVIQQLSTNTLLRFCMCEYKNIGNERILQLLEGRLAEVEALTDSAERLKLLKVILCGVQDLLIYSDGAFLLDIKERTKKLFESTYGEVFETDPVTAIVLLHVICQDGLIECRDNLMVKYPYRIIIAEEV